MAAGGDEEDADGGLELEGVEGKLDTDDPPACGWGLGLRLCSRRCIAGGVQAGSTRGETGGPKILGRTQERVDRVINIRKTGTRMIIHFVLRPTLFFISADRH